MLLNAIKTLGPTFFDEKIIKSIKLTIDNLINQENLQTNKMIESSTVSLLLTAHQIFDEDNYLKFAIECGE